LIKTANQKCFFFHKLGKIGKTKAIFFEIAKELERQYLKINPL